MDKTMFTTGNEDDETYKKKRTKTIDKLLGRGCMSNTPLPNTFNTR